MCVLIYKPEGVKIENFEEICYQALQTNSDGMGFVAADTDKKEMFHYRTLTDKDKFTQLVELYQKYQMIIHFRDASMKSTLSTDNCHPFHIKNDLFMGHEGSFPGYSDVMGVKSDSRLMSEKLGQIDNVDKCLRLTDGGLSVFNKVSSLLDNRNVVLMNMEDYYIFGEENGYWHQNVYYRDTYGRVGNPEISKIIESMCDC